MKFLIARTHDNFDGLARKNLFSNNRPTGGLVAKKNVLFPVLTMYNVHIIAVIVNTDTIAIPRRASVYTFSTIFNVSAVVSHLLLVFRDEVDTDSCSNKQQSFFRDTETHGVIF